MPQSGVSIDPAVLGGVQLALDGHRELASERLTELWNALPEEDLFHRCIVAHYMADLQPDPRAELTWDQRALDAAARSSPDSFEGRIPGVSYQSFLPSLHLNLAASHERVGEFDAARQQARAARETLTGLVDTPLGDLTHSAILRICERLGVDARTQTSDCESFTFSDVR